MGINRIYDHREVGLKVREVFKRDDVSYGDKVERTLEAFNRNQFGDPSTLNFQGFAEGLLGAGWQEHLRRQGRGGGGIDQRTGKPYYYGKGLESYIGVDPSAFTNITGQILVNKVGEGYNNPAFIGSELVEEIQEPSVAAILGELLVPSISSVIDLPSGNIAPGQNYPLTRVKEDYYRLPSIAKHGQILPITIEAIVMDRTGGQLQDAAYTLGQMQGLRKEEEILSVVLGLRNNYNWLGTDYNTYLTSGGWINKKTGVTITAGTFTGYNVWEQQQLFTRILNPFTNKPIFIDISKMKILCMPTAVYAMQTAVNAVSIRTGQISTNPAIQQQGPNPLITVQGILQSPYAFQLLIDSGVSATNAANYWNLGIFPQAFAYRTWIPVQMEWAPPGNPADFYQDIVYQVKCHEAGVAGVKNARFTSQSIGS